MAQGTLVQNRKKTNTRAAQKSCTRIFVVRLIFFSFSDCSADSDCSGCFCYSGCSADSDCSDCFCYSGYSADSADSGCSGCFCYSGCSAGCCSFRDLSFLNRTICPCQSHLSAWRNIYIARIYRTIVLFHIFQKKFA